MNRHIWWVFLVISVIGCNGAERRALSRVEQSSRAVQAAFEGKAPLTTYRDALAAYSREIASVQGALESPANRAVLAEYEAALKNLTDLLLVWEAKEAKGSEMLPVGDDVAGRIARDYSLGINTNEPPSIYATEAINATWEAAQQHLRAARLGLGVRP